MNKPRILKGSLAATVIYLVLFFPTAATPLFFNIPEISPTFVRDDMADSLSQGNAYNTLVSEWKRYDINLDERFDLNDIELLIEGGWQDFDYDLNADGVKDFDDALALFLKLSVMDRSCDGEVNDEDFGP